MTAVSRLPTLDEVNTELATRKLGVFIQQAWDAIDPAEYVHGWHIDLIAEHLEAVTRGEIKRLLINIPPRCMKSIGACVAWPAWTWAQPKMAGRPLQGPHARWMFNSYAHTLSIRDSVKCRRLMESRWYRERWGHRFKLTGDQNTKVRYDNDQGGYRLATSVEGTGTGDGGDIIVIDDPHNATEVNSDAEIAAVTNWWDQALSTRRNSAKTGAYVVIMQRLSDRDLAGHIINGEYDRWTHLCLPMRYEPDHPYCYGKDPRAKTRNKLLWPEHLDEQAVKDLERGLKAYGSAGQLQQRPAPAEGGMFKRAWFKPVGAIPHGARPYRAWDLAASDKEQGTDPDSTATAKLWKLETPEGPEWYIQKILYFEESGLAVEREIKNQAKLDGKYCPIFIPQDPGQAGKSQAEYYVRQLAGYLVFYHVMSGSKEARAKPWAIQAEAGHFYIVVTGRPDEDEWIERFLGSATIFPNGRHEDDIDAVSDCFELSLEEIPVPVVAPVEVEVFSPYSH